MDTTWKDFILRPDGRHIALEINTNIGLSETHDIAFAFAVNGLDYPTMVRAHLASAFAPRRPLSTDAITVAAAAAVARRPDGWRSLLSDVGAEDPTLQPDLCDQLIRAIPGGG